MMQLNVLSSLAAILEGLSPKRRNILQRKDILQQVELNQRVYPVATKRCFSKTKT